MRMCNKALLALACTAALSACDGEKVANSIAKRDPLIMQEAGLYQAQLLSGTSDKSPLRMLSGLDGVALIYPKSDIEQRWGVWVDNNDKGVVTASQWVGKAAQQLPKDKDFYPVVLTRNSERFQESGGLHTGDTSSNDHNLISFKDQSVRDSQDKEVKRWVFDFRRTGIEFEKTKSPLYPQWEGMIALNPIAGGTKSVEPALWVSKDDQGFSYAMTGNLETAIAADGKLSVLIEMPAAGCTLIGKGDKPAKGLNKLTFNLKSPDKGVCVFDEAKVQSVLEMRWTMALAKAETVTAYTTAFSVEGRDQLVIGFPEMDGFMLVAEKKK